MGTRVHSQLPSSAVSANCTAAYSVWGVPRSTVRQRATRVAPKAFFAGDYVPQYYGDIAAVNSAIVQDLARIRGSTISTPTSKYQLTTPKQQLLQSLKAAQVQVEAAERFVSAGQNYNALAVLRMGALGTVKAEVQQNSSGNVLESVESKAVQMAESGAFTRLSTGAIAMGAIEALESSAIDVLETGALNVLEKRLSIGPALYRLLPAEEVKITLRDMEVAQHVLQVNEPKDVCLEELRELADQLGSLRLLLEYGNP